MYVSTSYVERQNLSLRMGQRRFTRLTNGFSKKLDNHVAAVALYVAHYNLCRAHEAHCACPDRAGTAEAFHSNSGRKGRWIANSKMIRSALSAPVRMIGSQ